MFNGLGFSVYLSNFEQIKPRLSSLYKEGSCIFTSFHVSEEFDENYRMKAEKMCRYLRNTGYEILADVSKKTLQMFECENIVEFAKKMGISILRIDYGFSEAEMISIAKQIPICLNASTVSIQSARRIVEAGGDIYAMHNFYPRPETGLDEEFFDEMNRHLQQAGVKVLAFIPGNEILRGPLSEGLPTLESHRKASPYAAYVDLKASHRVDGIFVGDGTISSAETDWITRYETEQVITVPIKLSESGETLYNRKFTIRADSPRWLKRFQESREYSCFGETIQPFHCVERKSGSVTVDNIGYKRYSGEVQLIIEDLPADARVNVLGQLEPQFKCLLKNIKNGDSVMIQS